MLKATTDTLKLALLHSQKVGLSLQLKRHATYHCDTTNALTASHEGTKMNPLIQMKGKGTYVFQHPCFGKDICEETGCTDKQCNTPCGPLKEKVYTGHCTHNGNYSGTRFLSYTDCNGQNRAQYGVFYSQPIPNRDTAGEHVNVTQTTELNNNKEMLLMVHIYSSIKPTDDTTDYGT